jgi:UDP-glucose 4-epimerase
MRIHRGQAVAIVGAGFIGRHLIRAFLSLGYKVQVLDRNACPTEFITTVHWLVGDFHDRAALTHILSGAALAYHLVSSTVPGDLNLDVAREIHDNVVGSLHFSDVCLKVGVTRMVFASSASVYGLQTHFPISESAATNPISAHGVHKLAVEKFLLIAKREHGLESRILRLANPYGPGQSLQGRQGFIAIAIGCLLNRQVLTLRDAGAMVRDFIYVTDLANAMLNAGLRDDLPAVINLGSGLGHSLREVVDTFKELSSEAFSVIDAPARVVDIPLSVMDISLAREVLNFSPETSLRDGITKTLRYHGVQLRSD